MQVTVVCLRGKLHRKSKFRYLTDAGSASRPLPTNEREEYLCSLEIMGYVVQLSVQRYYSDEPLEVEVVICTEDNPSTSDTDIIGVSVPGQTRQTRKSRYTSILQSWLKDCDRHHGCYRGHSPLPTRVLDVGHTESDPVKLHISHGEISPYVALSHCWGSDELLRTTTKNIAAHQRQIIINHLPSNFWDAIAVTRSLKLRYLWIDAICIIQDDPHDWELESKVMCNIYSDAFVVIGADKASQSGEGFLKDSEHLYRYDEGGLYTIARVQNEGFSVYAIKNTRHRNPCRLFIPETVKTSEPLGSRAWTFQEQALARRMIHFASREVIWECDQTLRCECERLAPDQSRELISHNWSTAPLPERFHTWSRFVDSVCRRDITYVSDRLPALSGLADRMGEDGRSGTYLAGLWSNDLPLALCWRTVHPLHRVVPYAGPSFSWVSVYDKRGFEPYDLRYRYIQAEQTILHAEVLDVACRPSGANPFGAFSSGHIKLQAPLVMVDPVYIYERVACIVGRHSRSDAWKKPQQEPTSGHYYYSGNEDSVEVYYDYLDPWDQQGSYYAVLLSWTRNERLEAHHIGSEVVSGLVLKSCGNITADLYERVGIFIATYDKAINNVRRLFEGANKRVVTIV